MHTVQMSVMTDITTSDDNCVDGFIGDGECTSGVFDDDSSTRHFCFENDNQDVVRDAIDNRDRNEGPQEVDSDLSDCDDVYQTVDDCSNESRIKRRKRVMLKNEKLVLQCGWINCSLEERSLNKFVKHVTSHISDIAVRVIDEDTETYTCLWQSCGFNSTVADEIKRHVNFHSYHTKLKSIGMNIKNRVDLPDCLYKESDASFIPDSLYPYKCAWSDCLYTSSCIQNFFFHVSAHVSENFSAETFCCQWKGCGNNFANLNKLNCHVRVHTKEKLVACPDCGGMFASNTKFIDHCKRQLPLSMLGYECAHCFKLYSSERILRDHMRSHINVVKCIYCDMTCANKFTLAAHIRFRHLKLKPFICNTCDYRCETKQDLDNHTRTHDGKFKLTCDESGCNFSCRSQNTLKKHILQEHEDVPYRIYECHECGKQFTRGVHLTYHLMSRHNLRWPSGHKRFSYRPDEEGKYKLQQIRYESLEATEQITSNKSDLSDEEETSDTEHGSRSKEYSDKRILITMDEVNESSKKIVVEISSVKPVDSLPDGATIIAECHR